MERLKLKGIRRKRIYLFILLSIIFYSCTKDVLSNNSLTCSFYISNFEFNLPLDSVSNKIIFNKYSIFDNYSNREYDYGVILPTEYFENDNSRFPVLYLLHGLNNNCDCWINSFSILTLLTYYSNQYNIPCPIIIMPNAEDSYYVDQYQEDIYYEKFFIYQLIETIEKEYRIIEAKEGKFIAGFSMGGYGALHYALNYPEKFNFAFSMSGALGGKDSKTTPSILLTAHLSTNRDFPFFTIDIGNNDSFLDVNLASHIGLLNLGIEHEFILRDGAHDKEFWQESLFLLLERIYERIKIFYE